MRDTPTEDALGAGMAEVLEAAHQEEDRYFVRYRTASGGESAHHVRMASLRAKAARLEAAAQEAEGSEQDRILGLLETTQALLAHLENR